MQKETIYEKTYCCCFPLTLLLGATKSQALLWLSVGMKQIDVKNLTLLR